MKTKDIMETKDFQAYIDSMFSDIVKLITEAYTSTLIDGIPRGIRIQELDDTIIVDIVQLSIDNANNNSIHWI